MTCPSPFVALQALQPPVVKTWDTHCNWTAYLQSDAASLERTFYLRKECMSTPGNDTAVQCPLFDQYCNSAEFVFASRPLLTVCSLYPNMTLDVLDINMHTSNEIVVNNTWRDPARKNAFELSSIVSTGLLSYCSKVPGCSRSAACSTASLSRLDGRLSSHGVAKCWSQICNSYVASINPDFGGLGVRLPGLTKCIVH